MDHAALLNQFQAKVDEFARYQEFIDKARSQASRFAPAVVERVISSNREKLMSVVEALIPLTSDVEDRVSALRKEREGIQQAHADSNLQMQELELRLAIGELDAEGFDAEAGGLRRELEGANAKVAELQSNLDELQAALDRWTDLGTAAGVLSAETVADVPAAPPAPSAPTPPPAAAAPVVVNVPPAAPPVVAPPAPAVTPAPVAALQPSGFVVDTSEDELDDDVEVFADQDEIVEIHVDQDSSDGEIDEDDGDLPDEDEEDDDLDMDDADGVHAERVSYQEDVSSIFGGEGEVEAETRQEEVLLADDVLPADDGDLDILSEDEPLELDAGESAAEIKPRRAVLIYAEASSDEQVHPITKDSISLGRGRDNDIQVRNDSKVSRYHCKIYRRGPNYYIEDNKSANGSLVNGELITERRLFGGEEIIIGETFFRFRILD